MPERVRRALDRFLGNLRLRYPDAEVYLTGSYARGDWLEDSDVDLIVVSGLFRESDMAKRIAELRLLAPRDVAFEILAYTPEEFKTAIQRSVVLRDMMEYAVRLS